MIIVNKPERLETVKCWKCQATWEMHPMANMNSDYVKDCTLHNDRRDGGRVAELPPECSPGNHVYDDEKICIVCLGYARNHACVGGWL